MPPRSSFSLEDNNFGVIPGIERLSSENLLLDVPLYNSCKINKVHFFTMKSATSYIVHSGFILYSKVFVI